MEVFDTVAAFGRTLEAARVAGRSVGLVPTMGALHAGHRSLMARAVAECDHVAVTIFVNPLQFTEPDDIEHYPQTLPADLAMCEAEGVATVLASPVAEMYPDWPGPVATTVSVRGVSEPWEGASRPGHFDGVATVVAKLFSMAGRCRAYFGEKDFQQLAVVRRMATDLSMPVEVVGCPTVRGEDGLALSSRNVRLSPLERSAAVVLPRALAAGREAVTSGEHRPEVVASLMARIVEDEPLAALEYAAAVDAADLTVPPALSDVASVRLLVAARVGPVRLIDNCEAPVPLMAVAGTVSHNSASD
ncbi:MAG TPA: pantoate--beta-alanine ligase [Acidimicrobiales bacterium]|jgi:pantoate--beta-alanine ligase